MAMHEHQQKGLVFKDPNGVELPMIDGDGPCAGAAGVEIVTNDNTANLAKHPYLANNPYRDLDNDDDDGDDDNGDNDNNDGGDNIELVAALIEDYETIIDIEEEST